jgi:prevent-host-death family protein
VTAISSSQLRNSTAHLLERVEGGEELVITVDGRPVARLVPMGSRQWIPRAEFLHRVIGHQADAKLSGANARWRPTTRMAPSAPADDSALGGGE